MGILSRSGNRACGPVAAQPARTPNGWFEAWRMWLDESQRLLLLAALLKGASAAAWRQWRRTNEVDALEGQTAGLTPMLYHNLEDGGVDRADLLRLRGTYKFHWAKYQLARKTMARAVDCLADVNVAWALHRESALAFGGHYLPGTRPLQRLDLLIKADDLAKADAALRVGGWSAFRSMPDQRLMPFLPGMLYQHATEFPVYLVWHPSCLLATDAANDAFWQRLRTQEMEGVSISRPDTTDLLLIASVHTATWGAACRGPVTFSDLYVLATGAGGQVDWQALRERVVDLSVSAEVFEMLRRFEREVHACSLHTYFPPELLAATEYSDYSGGGTLWRGAQGSKYDLVSRLADHWRLYRRVCQVHDDAVIPLGFFAYLLLAHRWYWQVSSVWRMPLRLARIWFARLGSAKTPLRERGEAVQPKDSSGAHNL